MSIGKSNKNSKLSGTYSGTDTTTTQNTTPAWVSTAAPQLFDQASALASANPQTYVAGPSALQTQAGSAASGLSLPWEFQGAGQDINSTMMKAAPQATFQAASPYIDTYMSPYLKDVLDSSLAAFDNAGAQTQAQQDLQMAGSGAFGGSGAAIDKALTNSQLALGRGQLASTVKNQGFTTALGAAENDANNQNQVSQTNAGLQNDRLNRNAQLESVLANIGTAVNNAQNQNVATQAAVGSQLQGIQQQQAAAPLDLQSWLGQYFSGLPLNLFSGQTSTENQSGTQSSTGNSSGMNFGFKFAPAQ